MPDATNTYIETPYDTTSTSAPYYWNKTCIPTASTDFRIHDDSLSDVEVVALWRFLAVTLPLP